LKQLQQQLLQHTQHLLFVHDGVAVSATVIEIVAAKNCSDDCAVYSLTDRPTERTNRTNGVNE